VNRSPAGRLREYSFAQVSAQNRGANLGHRAGDLVKLLGFLDEDNFGAQLFEPEAVGVKVALQG
jgi:hypothetical protein